MTRPAWHVVHVTTGTWEQRTVSRHRSPTLAATLTTLLNLFRLNRRASSYHTWET